ncbi:YadA-like family protein [Veillonella sp.]|uniref:YadA-like family protein n=1 Tax=Veillonella sp. TaxID=1926307 RepID=UPI0028FE1EF3|nr:YadA-like family protein [Veillonella sp.]MDU1130447.1 YadA-like family protein [Veillonella sp.]MDU2869626.1 YadA-like family protein [Veillonella sp.]
MSKKHFVLTGIVFSALSMGIVSAAPVAPVNIVENNGNVGAIGTTFTNDGNITLGKGAGATTSTHQIVNSANANGNNVAIGAFAGNQSKGGGNITLGGKSFQKGTGDLNVIAGAMAANNAKLSTSIIMGTQSGEKSEGEKNVWLGHYQGANSTANNSVLIGSGSSVKADFTLGIGHYTNINAKKGLAIGSYNTLSDKATESGVFGQGQYGKNAIDASGSYSIGNYNHISGNNTFVMGNNVTTALENAVILGNDSTDGDVVGTSSYTFNNGKTVNYAGTTPISTVSIGAKDKERTITNVAAGRVSATSTDAINGSQLYGVHQMIDTLNQSTNAQLHDSINRVEQNVQRIESESNKGDARTAALAALHPMGYDPDNRIQYMAGYGHYKNANALALGVGYYHRDNLLLTTGVTLNSHLMANVGITYKPGKSNMTNHPQNLETRVQALEIQNRELQETVRQLMSKLDK